MRTDDVGVLVFQWESEGPAPMQGLQVLSKNNRDALPANGTHDSPIVIDEAPGQVAGSY